MENTYKLTKKIEKDGNAIEKININFKELYYKTFSRLKKNFIKKNKNLVGVNERELLFESDFVMILISEMNKITIEELENSLSAKKYLGLYGTCIANLSELFNNFNITDDKYELDYEIILNDNLTKIINLDFDELSVADLKQIDKEFRIRKIEVGSIAKEFSSAYAMMVFAKLNNCVLEDFQEQLSVIDYLNIAEYYNSQSIEDDEDEGND